MSVPDPEKPKPVKRRCHRCHGSGRAPCSICGGKGQTLTGYDRQSRPVFDRCTGCFGLKTTRCAHCGGEGFV